jgi:transposase InsO family protein
MKKRKLDQLLKKELKVKDLMKDFDVSTQTISKWKAKYIFGGIAELQPKKPGQKSGTCWNKTEENIENKIMEIAKEYLFKGPDWIAEKLLETENIKINQSTVYRILKRKKVRYFREYKRKKRKVKSYCLAYPGQEVQLDCSFPFGYEKKAVVYDAIDDCSRFVFGQVYKDHTAQSTILFLKQLIKRSPFIISAIRTDCGREFLNKDVKLFLEENNIEHRINPPYTPQHNGKIERFHRTLKDDSVYVDWFFKDDLETLNYKFSLFLDFYNFQRKHTGLGMNKITPIQKLRKFYSNISPSKNVNLILQQNKSCHKIKKVVLLY